MIPSPSLNDFIMAIDRERTKILMAEPDIDWRTRRAQCFWDVLCDVRPKLAKAIGKTDKDPRKLMPIELDGWLGWMASRWNRDTP